MSTHRWFRSLLALTTINLATLASMPAGFQRSPALTVGTAASAQTATPSQPATPPRVRWVPNRKMGSARSTLSGGRRGQAISAERNSEGIATCYSEPAHPPTQLTLLVPNTIDVLYTTAATPTFFWQTQTAQPVAARFVLSDPNTAQPVFTKTLQIKQAGISRVELPAELALKTGTRYRWTVLLKCDGKTANEISARSFVERVMNSSEQKVTPRSSLDRAANYAAQGIWYDALTTLIDAAQQAPDNAQIKAELKSLLAQVGKPMIQAAALKGSKP